jgi:hypothetical protein
LVGDPGTRKGTAINPSTQLLKESNFSKFSPDRLSAERFIIELEASGRISADYLDGTIELEDMSMEAESEIYVNNGEFGDFIGDGNLNFIRLLTNLWDNLPEYRHPKIHGKSANISKPTVNILSGTTSQDIATSIPVEAIGQGFLSRFIFVYGDSLGRIYSRLPPTSTEAIKELAKDLKEIKATMHGELIISEEVWAELHKMYLEFQDIDDFRFKHYSTRRYTHLLKLCLIISAMKKEMNLTIDTCIFANTILHFTEMRMSKALGEFGKGKNSDTANTVMSIIRDAKEPMLMKDIFKRVAQDLTKQSDLIDILKNLKDASKIQVIARPDKKLGYAPMTVVKQPWKNGLINPEMLTLEERL